MNINVLWILGAGFCLFPLVFFIDRRCIEKNKVEVDAVVVNTIKSSVADGTSWFPVFRYTVAGSMYETKYNVGNARPKYPNGTVVRIYCHRENAKRIMIPKDKTVTAFLLIFSIIGLALLGIAAYRTITGA
ncbi:MAG: hypothetical protein FWF60_00165 [Oscillospiraceae bacterium]|nr:hypothetical protein [Oscillospiraceae bacterium]